jgi:hypothetical protein
MVLTVSPNVSSSQMRFHEDKILFGEPAAHQAQRPTTLDLLETRVPSTDLDKALNAFFNQPLPIARVVSSFSELEGAFGEPLERSEFARSAYSTMVDDSGLEAAVATLPAISRFPSVDFELNATFLGQDAQAIPPQFWDPVHPFDESAAATFAAVEDPMVAFHEDTSSTLHQDITCDSGNPGNVAPQPMEWETFFPAPPSRGQRTVGDVLAVLGVAIDCTPAELLKALRSQPDITTGEIALLRKERRRHLNRLYQQHSRARRSKRSGGATAAADES